ncbi:hypothetical protein [Neolewinella agarilytica]|uniref:hypothetical protein n=1 Tax=Neolewinella agarilytica TaxID=478744 RepID=UPI002356BA7E|nr:hypothetical protein [Neolewinella agarilytica]
MKTNFLILFSLLLITELSAQAPDTIRKFYPNGRPAVYHLSLEGKATGQWLEWYPDGTLRYDAEWLDGMGHGLWRYFHPNGRVSSEYVYLKDQPTGLGIDYYDNGEVKRKTTYLDGRREGRQEHYTTTGELERVDFYLNGQLDVRSPRLFAPGSISSPKADEFGLAFSPTGDTLYLTRRYPGERQQIYLSFRINDRWSDPVPAPWSGNRDEGAAPSSDGRYVLFASYRTTDQPKNEEALMDMNLWRVNVTPNGWSEPYPLPGDVNQIRTAGTPWAIGYEAGPVLDENGTLYYWTAGAEGTDPDLLRARRMADGRFGRGEELRELNTDGSESSPAISPDGNLLCFSAYGREGGFGGEDLYCAYQQDGQWSSPVNLGPAINSAGEEAGARFSPDGEFLYFTRQGASGTNDIFYVSVRNLLIGR